MDHAGKDTFKLTPDVEKKLQHSIFTVEFPEDITAVHEAQAKAQGAAIHDTLSKAVEAMELLRATGQTHPELEAALK